MKQLLALLFILYSLHCHSQAIKAAVTMRHGTAASSSLLNGLVGGWKMNESSGNITDYSGNSNTGTANGSLTYSQSGILNNAILFDGSTSYFDMGNTSSLSLTSAGSISAWVYCSNVSVFNVIISKGNYASGLNGYTLAIEDDGSLDLLTGNGSTFSRATTSASIISANTWHNIVATWNGSLYEMWLDGTQVITDGSQTVTPVSTTYNFYMGAQGDNQTVHLFHGKMNNVYIWNRAITSTEVASLYNSGSSDAYPF